MSGEQQGLLDIRGLNVSFPLDGETVYAVRDVSFSIRKGETMGLVGESGCGKSVTAFSILRLLARPGTIDSGSVLYRGRDLLSLSDEDMRRVRGKEIAMIFQEPMTSLNPVFTIGFQITESIRLHLGMGPAEARDLALDLLDSVGIPNPSGRFSAYPHEFSGGMRQRVMIAMALAPRPAMLIADEPTTALDVTIQAQILDLLMDVQRKNDMSLLLITHDLGIVANIADSVAIMYAGEIVESGSTTTVFEKAAHPYTRGLFNAIPRMGSKGGRLKTIPGTVPTVNELPGGCPFHPRCFMAADECLAGRVALIERDRGHAVRCVRY
jgi:peptide/nickel transport system ATP-binding protein